MNPRPQWRQSVSSTISGNFDTIEAVRALSDVGFDGAVLPDHVPEMVDDTDWRHRGRGFTIGYLRGVIDTVATER